MQNLINTTLHSLRKIFLLLALSVPAFIDLSAMASRPTDPNAPPPPVWVQFFPMLVMVGVFYFLLIRPQMRQRKERENMMNSLKKGDRIVTQGGLFATVVNINPDSIEIKLNEETKVKLRRSAVADVLKTEIASEPVVTQK